MCRSKWKRKTLTAAVMFSVTCGWAQTKVVTLDLTPYGVMTDAELSVLHTIAGYIVAGPPGGIAWGGVGTLAIDSAGYVYVGLPIWASGYAPKNPVRGTGDKFRVLAVNVASGGKVERTMDFPSESLDRLALHLADDGTLLVFANDALMRVGSNGRPTAQLAVPNEQKQVDNWDVDISTTGGTLRLRLNNQHTIVVNAKTLAVEKQCQEKEEEDDTGTMTDDLELSSRSTGTSPNPSNGLERETFCEKGSILSSFGKINFVPAIVSDNQFLAIEEGSMALRKLSGETVWTSNPPAPLLFDTREGRYEVNRDSGTYEGRYELSRDGSRVTIQLLRVAQYQPPETQETRPMQVEDSVGVWDVATGRLVGEVPLLGHTTDRFFNPDSKTAVSPDGKLLAVLEEGVLTVWRVE
jgi:hypothetical protein